MPNESAGLLGSLGRNYGKFAGVANYGQSFFLLIIRLYIGFVCARSGVRHLTHFQNTVNQFKEWNIPVPTVNVAVSGTTELVGGSLLLVGLASRLVGLILTGNFIVAIAAPTLASDLRDNLLHFWNYPDVIIGDTAFPFLMTAIIVLLFGPGWFSIDGIIRVSQRKPAHA